MRLRFHLSDVYERDLEGGCEAKAMLLLLLIFLEALAEVQVLAPIIVVRASHLSSS